MIVRNGGMVATVWAESIPYWATASNIVILSLEQGDEVWLLLLNRASYLHGYMYSTFSGFLVFENWLTAGRNMSAVDSTECCLVFNNTPDADDLKQQTPMAAVRRKRWTSCWEDRNSYYYLFVAIVNWISLTNGLVYTLLTDSGCSGVPNKCAAQGDGLKLPSSEKNFYNCQIFQWLFWVKYPKIENRHRNLTLF